MTVHLLRKAFHAETLEDLAEWQDRRRKESKAQGRGNKVRTFLRNAPTRGEELLDGGSIYWIVKNQIRARQRVLAIERVTDPEARRRCALVLDREIVATVPYPVRARRGWRYLESTAVPDDLPKAAKGSTALPADLAAELRELGLL